ncbi:MAG: hypothetical protein HOJ15_03585 [Candidatus Jacksonbacteria bacterium]|jgi:hypothetical protein|nr:hypothetical protein [Candidatus Jacksonbacteria bacterium]MBT6034472.1 hypothetical protein [Candidatus Jacksonbacteria bacterium]MBT6301481.1 hypothetical protein [Candidatus Jacksonbacteria bacterium]MBT6756891.1 hypothetical protein [Candidatus Jacksonbacteria bacterium]MBT6954885.1 hypothetical protein [Candidatus Jacksonbacteria bacterium]
MQSLDTLRSTLSTSKVFNDQDIENFIRFLNDQPEDIRANVIELLSMDSKETVERLDRTGGKLSRAIKAGNEERIEKYTKELLEKIDESESILADEHKIDDIQESIKSL